MKHLFTNNYSGQNPCPEGLENGREAWCFYKDGAPYFDNLVLLLENQHQS